MPVDRAPEILFDARWLRTGIGRYILTLLSRLKPHLGGANLTCITMPEHVATIKKLCDRVLPMSCGIYTLKEQLLLPAIDRQASLFCAPHYNAPIFRSGPLVATVHDITHLIFPEYANRWGSRLYARPILNRVCARATRITVPSHYTRRRLIEQFTVDASKLRVIPCAVSPNFSAQDKAAAANRVRREHNLSRSYIFSVTSAAPHKNLILLLQAYHRLLAQHRELPMFVLVMPESPSSPRVPEEMRRLLANPNIRCLQQVNDDLLASLYAAAEMSILPSIEEGFGLPIIESMACGTPVACSRAGSLPEVADGAAIYFQPASIEEMGNAILNILESSDLRRDLTAAGLKRAADFTADGAAHAYASMVREALAANDSPA